MKTFLVVMHLCKRFLLFRKIFTRNCIQGFLASIQVPSKTRNTQH